MLTRLAEVVDQLSGEARYLRSLADYDLPPTVTAVRSGQVVATAAVVEPAYPLIRDDILVVAAMMADGLAADFVGLSVESLTSSRLQNPDTGRPWGAGEMALFRAMHPGPVGRTVVTDQITTLVTNRAGDLALSCQPYVATGDGRVERWEEELRADSTRQTWRDQEGWQSSGALTEGLLRLMEEQPVLLPEDLGAALGAVLDHLRLDRNDPTVVRDFLDASALASFAGKYRRRSAGLPGVIFRLPEAMMSRSRERIFRELGLI